MRPGHAAAIRAAGVASASAADLQQCEALVLMTVAYFQQVTRGQLGQFFGAEISRDTIAVLRRTGFIAAGPRGPQPGAPYAYVTTPAFVSHFGFGSLGDLPDMEKLEDAGLLGRASRALRDDEALVSELNGALGPRTEEGEPDEDAA